ncbi:replication factor A protein 2 [Diutina catenulata]
MSFTEGGFDANDDFGSGSQKQTRSSLTPVTIHQINTATSPVPDGEFTINNVELASVEIMGVVRRVDSQSSAINVTIEDGTGSIEIRKWIDEAVMSMQEEQERFDSWNGQYVRVCGTLKEFQGKKNVQNAHIEKVDNYNRVTNHFLAAIKVHLAANGVLGAKAGAGNAGDNELFVSNDDGSLKDQILRVLRQNGESMAEGVQTAYLSQTLGVPESELEPVLLGLQESGTIFSGSDDNAWIAIEGA